MISALIVATSPLFTILYILASNPILLLATILIFNFILYKTYSHKKNSTILFSLCVSAVMTTTIFIGVATYGTVAQNKACTALIARLMQNIPSKESLLAQQATGNFRTMGANDIIDGYGKEGKMFICTGCVGWGCDTEKQYLCSARQFGVADKSAAGVCDAANINFGYFLLLILAFGFFVIFSILLAAVLYGINKFKNGKHTS